MDEYEDLKKIYIDKEKENMKLKEELSNMKGRYNLTEKDKSTKEVEKVVGTEFFQSSKSHSSRYNNNQDEINDDNVEEDNMEEYDYFEIQNQQFVMNQKHSSNINNVKYNAYNYGENFSNNFNYKLENHRGNDTSCNINSPIEKQKENFFSTKTAKAIDLGRIYDEAIFRDKLKIGKNSLIDEINENNKELKEGTIGKIIEQMSNRILNELKEKNENLELINQDLKLKLKIKEDENKEIKESYEKELKLKSDIYVQNMALINKTHNEETKKLRLDYEKKMDNIIKSSEEEKIEMSQLINKLEKENYSLLNKLNTNEKTSDKSEIIEFQKKYLSEMKVLQKEFFEYKEKANFERKNLKSQKEDLQNKLKSYKEAYKKLKDEFNSYENKSKENEIAFQQKLDNFKELIKGNESLKRDLEKTKSEMKHLKNQVNELEKSELLLKNMLGTNKIQKDTYKVNDLVNFNNSIKIKDIDLTNDLSDSHFSPYISPVRKQKSELLICDELPMTVKVSKDSSNFDFEEMLIKNIDLKKAREKIEEMEQNLKALSEENEMLKKKFDQQNQEHSPTILSNRENRESDNMTLRNTQISYKSNGENKILRDSKVKNKLEEKKEKDKKLVPSIKFFPGIDL